MRLNSKAFFYTLIIQILFFALFFIGFLLDPLLGLWFVFLYFIGCGSFWVYQCLNSKCQGLIHEEIHIS